MWQWCRRSMLTCWSSDWERDQVGYGSYTLCYLNLALRHVPYPRCTNAYTVGTFRRRQLRVARKLFYTQYPSKGLLVTRQVALEILCRRSIIIGKSIGWHYAVVDSQKLSRVTSSSTGKLSSEQSCRKVHADNVNSQHLPHLQDPQFRRHEVSGYPRPQAVCRLRCVSRHNVRILVPQLKMGR